MRTAEQIAHDERRLERCAQSEAAIDQVAAAHPGLSLTELVEHLPANEAARLLEMVDEVREWSRETHAVEVER